MRRIRDSNYNVVQVCKSDIAHCMQRHAGGESLLVAAGLECALSRLGAAAADHHDHVRHRGKGGAGGPGGARGDPYLRSPDASGRGRVLSGPRVEEVTARPWKLSRVPHAATRTATAAVLQLAAATRMSTRHGAAA